VASTVTFCATPPANASADWWYVTGIGEGVNGDAAGAGATGNRSVATMDGVIAGAGEGIIDSDGAGLTSLTLETGIGVADAIS
jgi:hypothetical protein